MMKRDSMSSPLMTATAIVIGAAVLIFATGGVAWARQIAKPNIVLLYIDDWAWNGTPVAMDDGMANSRMPVLRMPNVERLAREGMKFPNAYASPQCSPARVCVQTGQSSARSGFTVFMNHGGQDYYDLSKQYKGFPVIPCVSDMTIDRDAVTIPEALGPLGYVSAHIGKWHMRGDPGDEGYVLHDGDTSNDPGNTLDDDEKQRLPETLTDPKRMFSVTAKAIGFMEEQVKAGKPFYLQVSHYAMHEGRECLPATREKYARLPEVQAYYKKIGRTAETVRRKEDPAIWLGMGEDLDGRIGAVLEKIKALGVEDHTYVILTADNGYRHSFLPGLTQPLHGAKWWVWQGGIRVPMIVKGPGIRAGSVFKANVANYDFLPTFVEWAGGKASDLKDIDGVSLAAYMAGRTPDETFVNRRLYFHYPHYRTSMPHSAVVSGSRKVIHFYERPDVPMLFDLSADAAEANNIAKAHPQEHKRLYDDMMAYFKQVNARIPKLNPDYDANIYAQSKEYEKRTSWGPFAGQRRLDEDASPSAPPASLSSDPTPAADADDGSHLFILSGQSNMQGLDPQTSFIPAVEAAFGKGRVLVVKDAQGGQPMARWLKGWTPAQGEPPKSTGDLYDRLMTKVEAATAGKTIKSVTFIWMQGERDAKSGQDAVYEASLRGLIKQLRTDLQRDDVNVVIGRLSDHAMDTPGWVRVREAQVAVAEADPRGAWIDTDDLNDKPEKGGKRQNSLHHSAEGYRVMGERFGKKAIELVNKKAHEETVRQ